MGNIHPSAVLGKDVKLGENVTIHPYVVIDGNVEIGDNCTIFPFVYITGWVKIGRNNKIHSSASIGEPPQDYSFDGTPGLVEVGDNCLLREGVTIHTPVHGDQGEVTRVGSNVFLMSNVHIGHNVKVSDNVVMASGCVVGGYSIVEEYAFLSGNVAVHQFCRVGAYAIVGGVTKVAQDMPPYLMADGNPLTCHSVNVVGLKRRGFSQEQRSQIKDFYKTLYDRSRPRRESLTLLEESTKGNEILSRIVKYVKDSKRGLVSFHGE